MKKVAILTFHKSLNYGAVLQTYALKSIIKSFNVSCDVINYQYPVFNKGYRIFYKSKFNYRNIIKHIYFVPKMKSLFNDFINKFLTDTKPLMTKDLPSVNNKYDCFIAGSDQIWNGDLTDHDNSFLLDFVKDTNKINAYAASFGVSQLTDIDKQNYPTLLKRFKNISIREQQGVAIIKNLINKDVIQTLDPTFLLSIEEWKKLINNNKQKQNTIVVYLMGKDTNLISFAKNLAKTKNYKVVILRNSFKKHDSSVENLFVTPEQWLEYIYNAKYVVTNSFHGLTFSIKFNKPFFVGLVNTNKRKSRLENLLDLTNLKDRLIDNIGTDYDKPTDWDSVNNIIEKEREKSITYLKKVVL
ncbi:MAG: polysaccharide pyruvyl transferase family protein [Elusimicrobia bacterium]|nr:polysaccharide pyruvyl transferase family protein [Elusimicrobiota bacterium]